MLFFGREFLPLARELIAFHGGQHAGGLLSSHHADAGVGPHPQKSRRVGSAAHPVISGAERAADDDRELRHGGIGDCVHHLRAVFGDAASLILLSDHEAGDVLKK